MRKLLCIDCRMISMSGIGRYISELLPYIIKELKEDVVLLGKKKDLLPYDAKVIKFDAPIYSIQEQMGYRKIIPESKLFLSPHFNVPLLPINSQKRIATIHDAYHLAYYKELSLLQKIYAKKVINSALKRSDKIITVSNFSKKEILHYTDQKYKDKIEVVYNGVSDNKLELINYTNELNKKPIPYLLYVGNIKPHKNLERAIEAYALFLKNHPEDKIKPLFKIVGKRDGFINGSNNRLEELLNEQPNLKNFIVFTGYITDIELYKLYSEAIALIFPSKYEGFGLPPLEAMKVKCPVLASDIPSIKEICGDSVLYFDPNSIIDISKKINMIYSSKYLRNSLIINGNKKYREYTWKESAKIHLNIFKKLL